MIKKIRKFLRPVKRLSWAIWCRGVVIPYARMNYGRMSKRIIRRTGPVRVLFLVNELAKFKMKKVVEAMRDDTRFKVTIGLMLADRDWDKTTDEIAWQHDEISAWAAQEKVEWLELSDICKKTVQKLSDLKPDIVFYQQPWDYAWDHHPAVVSRFALTCYVQYFVPNYGNLAMDVGSLVARSMFRFYVLSDQWKQFYETGDALFGGRACSYVPVGHPMLDQFHDASIEDADGLVIYAPHWSITYPGFLSSEHYSTFIDNGRQILAYAKAHSEIKWVFKPHPNLSRALIDSGAWTKDEVDAYYVEWGKIGVACYTNDYPKLFLRSRLLITDCGSFLSEYASTGRPIVRLVSSTQRFNAAEIMESLFDSFYNVCSWEELECVLDMILNQQKDPKLQKRIAAAKATGLMGLKCTSAILDDCFAIARRGLLNL